MSSTDEAIIEFNVIINTRLSDDTENEIKKLQELKSLQDDVKMSPEEVDEITEKLESLQTLQDQIKSEDFDAESISQQLTETKEMQVELKEKETEVISKLEEIEQAAISEAIQEEGDVTTEDALEAAKKLLGKAEEKEDTSDAFGDTAEGEKFLRDPQKYVFDKVKAEFLDQFEDTLESIAPIALAILAVKLAPLIIQGLSVKGGPLNRDWRRFISEEVDVGLSRVQQKEKELGVSQVILTQVVGFHPNNENWTFNSLFDRNSQRYARIGLSDREAGVTMIRG